MGFLAFLLLGLIAGAIARAIMPDKTSGGWVVSLIVGVVGAMLGGWLGSLFFNGGLDRFFSIGTWVLAILGSLIVLWIYGAFTKRKS